MRLFSSRSGFISNKAAVAFKRLKKHNLEVSKVIPARNFIVVDGVGPTPLKKRHPASVSKLDFKLKKHKEEQQKLYAYSSGKDNLMLHLPVSNKQTTSVELRPKCVEVRGPSLSSGVVKQSSSCFRFPDSKEKARRHFPQSMAWQ